MPQQIPLPCLCSHPDGEAIVEPGIIVQEVPDLALEVCPRRRRRLGQRLLEVGHQGQVGEVDALRWGHLQRYRSYSNILGNLFIG